MSHFLLFSKHVYSVKSIFIHPMFCVSHLYSSLDRYYVVPAMSLAVHFWILQIELKLHIFMVGYVQTAAKSNGGLKLNVVYCKQRDFRNIIPFNIFFWCVQVHFSKLEHCKVSLF